MEHPVQAESEKVERGEVVLGWDLERRIMLTRDERGLHAIALTDSQIDRLRAHWRWIASHPHA